MAQVYYSKNDLADLLRLSVSTIDNKMKAGEILYYKIGKSVRFDESMIKDFLSNQKQKMYRQKSLSYKHRNADVSKLANAFGMVKDGKENG